VIEKTHRKEKPKILKYSRSHQHSVMALASIKIQNLTIWRAVKADSPQHKTRKSKILITTTISYVYSLAC
jgi:hypothetical protein